MSIPSACVPGAGSELNKRGGRKSGEWQCHGILGEGTTCLGGNNALCEMPPSMYYLRWSTATQNPTPVEENQNLLHVPGGPVSWLYPCGPHAWRASM